MTPIIDFKATRCRHCYKCVRNCEVKAIMVKDGRAEIMPDNCVLCGKCMQVCPQSAKMLVSDLDLVRRMIERGEKVYLSLAPAYMGLFKYHTIGQVRAALLQLGFADVRETSEGAALVTAEYNRLIAEGTMENIITTCCPSANDLIEKYYPDLTPWMAPVVSPMIAHGMLLKKELGSDCRVVFLGPCIAKKKEAQDARHSGYIDAVLNFNDIDRWLSEEDILIEDCEDLPFEKADPRVNRLYPVSSGVISSVLAGGGRTNDERTGEGQTGGSWTGNGDTDGRRKDGYRKLYVDGERECMELCESLQRGEIHGCFIEIDMCSGGCINGPAAGKNPLSRFKIKLDMEERVAREPVPREETEPALVKLTLAKTFSDHSPKDRVPTQRQIQEILAKTGKLRAEDELNCGACGYPTCREKAIAVFQKKAELNMCIPFMYEKSESFANLVIETSPNIVLIVDETMKILEYSAAGARYFGKSRTEALQMYLFEFIDPSDVQWVFDTHQNIHGKKVSYPDYHLDTLQNIVYIEKENAVLATFIDITKEEEQARQDYEKKLETIDLAQKVIHKQMMVAQEIAGLLGETTAETKTTLTTLCRTLLEDGEGGGK
ncbi:MAG: 4Fe-4S dicluster domain-containing protein [Clostridiales bacterium]|nr:4Fe-4S dicluster domain-containing protein [Clostridiales bacterium]